MLYQPYAGIAPSRDDNAYILALVPTIANGLAAITSANELFIVDRNLASAQSRSLDNAPNGTNCLVSGDFQGQTVLCSGTNGNVTTFDVRSQREVSRIEIDRAVTALACSGPNIAIGTELKSQQAIVSMWDVRQNKQVWQNAENNDEITTVGFHSLRQNILLAGGDDGLVSLFDTNVAEEDDSMVQAINHGPIHKAGFLGANRIFALSSDQNFSIYPVSSPGDEQDPDPHLIGDLRPLVPCQYVIDVLKSGEEYVVAVGTNIDASRIDVVRLENAQESNATPSLDTASKLSIVPAHGEEVVRAIFIDDETATIFTAGEDGYIRASRPSTQTADTTPKTLNTPKKSKHTKTPEVRYKPY